VSSLERVVVLGNIKELGTQFSAMAANFRLWKASTSLSGRENILIDVLSHWRVRSCYSNIACKTFFIF
jgi:hypothetical protein